MSSYDDIINLPHHVSQKHPQMSMLNRAAQFSPFAALTGYDAAIRESARLTERKIELGEDAKEDLSKKLRYLRDIETEHPIVTLIYFIPDARKDGGEYTSLTAQLKRIDEFSRMVLLMDGRSIPIDDILDADCKEFTSEEGDMQL